MAIKKCKECGTDVSTQADACPKCGARLKRRPLGCGGAILVIIILGVIVAVCSQKNNSPTSSPSTVYNNQATMSGVSSIPEKQIAFTEAIQSVKQEYAEAPNALKKSAIRTQRSKQIKSALKGSLTVTNWVGKLTHMETNRDGKAIIYIKLEGSGIQVGTWNNALSDFSDGTLIPQESPLYSIIAEMTEGQRVVFSGKFIHDEKDYARESSFTEGNSIADPSFIFKFDAIQSYQSYKAQKY